MPLSSHELRRYERHLLLPEFSREGQERLKRARALIVGAGGLGSPAALYLAAAGVGTLGLVDFDVVDETNLQRQIIYDTSNVGQPKLDAASGRLRALNPHVEVVLHEERFDAANGLALVKAYDLVIDGTDNFVTRYLVNDACVLAGKPNLYGSILRFEGQASIFATPSGPCYRCLHPEPPLAGLIPSCAEGGVLGVLPGIIGTIQATEAIKLLTGVGEPLIGRLLLYDALKMRFREIALPRDRDCPVCGDAATIRTLEAYEPICDGPVNQEGDMTVEELHQWRLSGHPHLLIDVRQPAEHARCRIDGARLLPLTELPLRLNTLPKDQPVVVHCKTGGRSALAAALLRARGYEAHNLEGGIEAWARRIDPAVMG